MKIVESQQVDVNDFINLIFSKDTDLKEEMKRTLNSPLNQGIFSLYDNNQLHLVASTYKSSWHPSHIYVQFAYDFSSTNAYVKKMLTFLQAHFEEALLLKFDDRFEQLHILLEEHHYQLFRETDICQISLDQLPSGGKQLLHNVQSVHEIRRDPSLYKQFILLCKNVYTSTHVDNPVADMPFTVWEKIVLDNLLEEFSLVLVDDGEVRAFSLMYEGDLLESCEFGWNGAVENEDLSILVKMLHYQIQILQNHGIRMIEKENDSTDRFSQYVLKDIPKHIVTTLYSYKGRCLK